MKLALAIASVLLASACGPQPCAPAYDLAVTGEAMPPDTALVIGAAQAHCDRPIAGVIEWRVGADSEGAVGRCDRHFSCPIDAWVAEPESFPNPVMLPDGKSALCLPGGALAGSALCTAFAHEIGHWCERTSDEDTAWTFSFAVQRDVLAAKGL